MPALEIPGVATSNIWLAASDGKLEVVEHFLQHGGPGGKQMQPMYSIEGNTLTAPFPKTIGEPLDPNIKDQNGYTPLHAAASWNRTELIRLLVTKYGANPNITDTEGDTPLHVAETVDCARLLVELGADPHKRNDSGQLPIESADEEEHVEVVEYLKTLTPNYVPAPHIDEDFSHMQSDDDDEDANNDDDESGDDEEHGHRITVSMGQLQELIQNGTLESVIRNAAEGGGAAGSEEGTDGSGGVEGRRGG
ncbi:hypothetical protein HDV00_004676 [Rhizophlyctis rosea]|nr:hypothetical protein HDV00_004676 [Rhizophlyctis rosea]